MSDAINDTNATEQSPAPAVTESSTPPVPQWRKYAALAEAAYTRAKPMEGYTIDPEFSDRNRTVYIDDETGKAHIAFRGTQLSGHGKEGSRWADVGADALIALSLQDLGYRFRGARKVTKQVMEKYGGADNVVLHGHSLGGSVGLYVHSRLGKNKPEVHAFNPGVSPVDVLRSKGVFGPEHVRSLFNKKPVFGANAHSYITRGDLISSLSPYLKGLRTHVVPMKGNRNAHAIRHFTP
jgi:hypothetical protein